jgi:hypothetical protein
MTGLSSIVRYARVACITTSLLIGANPNLFGEDHRPPATSDSAARSDERAERDFAGALVDSFKLVMLEHATRVAFQPKTRAELDGPFWRDYQRSITIPRQWEDTDNWLVNYVGHPIHGAGAGIVWLDHSDRDRASSLFSAGYVASRGRAAAFSAIYSVQFEIGPLSEASIGNVGLRRETAGWVDYVVTPAGAFAFMIAEDALDRYFVRWMESHIRNRVFRAAVRLIFGPSRFLANAAESRLPWYRPDRPLGGP